MPELHARVDARVLTALDALARSSGAPRDHLVDRALAEYLGVEHHTLYQVSTAGALVEGVYQGAVSVGVVREHGDFGLGTFADLDGEMVVLDGHVFRVSSAGDVHEVPDDATTPFAVVTRFGDPDAVVLDAVNDLAALTGAVDAMRDSANVFFAVRVDGHFDAVHVRAASGRRPTRQAWRSPAITSTSSPTTAPRVDMCSTVAVALCACACRRSPTCTSLCPTPRRSAAPTSPTIPLPTSTRPSAEMEAEH
jgi:hypothetical protein